MNRLSTFEEAAKSLEAVAAECNKTKNVDLDLLINEYEKGSQFVESLKSVEQDPVIQNALQQLTISQNHNFNILLKKRSQLDQAGLVPSSENAMAATPSNDEKQVNKSDSRRIAIEHTIISNKGVKFADVAGLEIAKETLREAIIMPLQYPHLFTGGRRPWRRILLYGPPGTGKTRLAQAVASEVRSTFYSVSSSDLISSWVGESEKLIKELFHDAQTRQGRSVIFIDEIDSICRKRSTREEEHTRRIKTELLKQMEGVGNTDNERYFLLCATNCPWELDAAFLRRFQKRIYIPLPDKQARIHLMKMHLRSTPSQLTEQDWSLLGDKTESFSGSDLANCISDALHEPIRELQHAKYWRYSEEGFYEPCNENDSGATKAVLSDIPEEKVHPRNIVLADFFKSLTHNQRTVTNDDLDRYHSFTQSFGQKG